jgi:molybdopterin/thiamine biosynthesis adenylyltransferase
MIDVRDVHAVLTSEWNGAGAPLAKPDLYATGSMQWRSGTSREGDPIIEALFDKAVVVDSIPAGTSRPPLDDFFVITARHGGDLTAASVLERIEPRASQAVVVLVLDALDHGVWDGVVCRDETVRPLAGFRVVGGGMLAVERAESPLLAVEEQPSGGAFSRLRGAVGDNLYRKLRRAVVTLIGVSRTGTLAAQQFAAIGVARLRLCDPDRLGEENLDGMPGVPRISLGEFKTHAVADMLLLQQPDMSVTCCEHSILAPEAAGLFVGRSDLIVTCVDDDTARAAAALHARRMLVPHLDLAASVQPGDGNERRIFGDARLFLPGQGCALCVPPPTPHERDKILYELAAPPQALRRGEPQAWNQQRSGSLITMNALVVSAGIAAWLDLLAGQLRSSFWQRLDWIPGAGLQVRASAIGANEACRVCRGG